MTNDARLYSIGMGRGLVATHDGPSGLVTGVLRMKMSILGAASAGIIIAAGVAVAGNFSSNHRTDFYASGTHQFYVWCSGSPDFLAMQSGASATDAQSKLYDKTKKQGRSACWPVWQGRVSG